MPAGLPIAAAVGGPLRYACYILDWYIVNPSLSCPKKCHRLHLPPVQAETVVTQGVPDTSELEARTAVSAYCFQRDPLFCWPAWEGLEARSGGLQQAPSYDRNQFDRGQRLLCLPCSLDFNRTASFAILQEARKEAERVAAEKERLAREAGRLEQVGSYVIRLSELIHHALCGN